MQEFLFILKGDGMNHLSPDELQKVFGEYQTWVEGLGEKYVGGQRLMDEGVLLKSKDAEIMTDGPFLEMKEIIAGYFNIKADNMEDAISIAKSSPHLGLYQIEVRPLPIETMK